MNVFLIKAISVIPCSRMCLPPSICVFSPYPSVRTCLSPSFHFRSSVFRVVSSSTIQYKTESSQSDAAYPFWACVSAQRQSVCVLLSWLSLFFWVFWLNLSSEHHGVSPTQRRHFIGHKQGSAIVPLLLPFDHYDPSLFHHEHDQSRILQLRAMWWRCVIP